MSHKIGLGSGFNDHMRLQYQLSSSPRYIAFSYGEKGVGIGQARNQFADLTSSSPMTMAAVMRIKPISRILRPFLLISIDVSSPDLD
jgi:hypothetical protein